jgi:hypothetical protein
MFTEDDVMSAYLSINASGNASCGELVIYRDPSRIHFVAKCPGGSYKGVYTKHLYEVDGGIEVKCPYRGTSDGVFTKAYRLLQFLDFNYFDMSRAVIDEMKADWKDEEEAYKAREWHQKTVDRDVEKAGAEAAAEAAAVAAAAAEAE